MGTLPDPARRLSQRLQLLIAQSPLRPILGSRTVVLDYVAPSSGAHVRLPVWALPRDGGWLVAVAAADSKRWWRAFRSPLRARIEDATGRIEVVGVALTGAERVDNLGAYTARVPSARKALGEDAPVIRFTLAEST